jgi:hypothetical protein
VDFIGVKTISTGHQSAALLLALFEPVNSGVVRKYLSALDASVALRAISGACGDSVSKKDSAGTPTTNEHPRAVLSPCGWLNRPGAASHHYGADATRRRIYGRPVLKRARLS